MYEIPGDLFQVPTAYVWIFTARLVTGQGLPYMAEQWAIGAASLFAVSTVFRAVSVGKSWRKYIPGGVAVAIGELLMANLEILYGTSPTNSNYRHVQCALIHLSQSRGWFYDVVLGLCEEEVKSTAHHTRISECASLSKRELLSWC